MISPTRNDRWFFSALLALLLALPALPTRGQEDLSSQLTLFQLQLSRTLARLQLGLTGIGNPDVRTSRRSREMIEQSRIDLIRLCASSLDRCREVTSVNMRISKIRYSDNGSRQYILYDDGILTVLETATGKRLKVVPLKDFDIYAHCISQDGTCVAWLGREGHYGVYDLKTDKELTLEDSHRIFDNPLAFSSDKRQLLTSNRDYRTDERILTIWDLEQGKPVRQIPVPWKMGLLSYDNFLVPDGSKLLALTNDPTKTPPGAVLVNMADGTIIKHWPGFHATALSPDGRWIAIGFTAVEDLAGWVEIDDAVTLHPYWKKRCHQVPIARLGFSPDSKQLFTAGEQGALKLWEWPQTEPVATLSGDSYILAVAFSPDRSSMVSACIDNTLRHWILQASPSLVPQPSVVTLPGLKQSLEYLLAALQAPTREEFHLQLREALQRMKGTP